MALTLGAITGFFKPKLVNNIPGSYKSYRNVFGIGRDISYDKCIYPAGKITICNKPGNYTFTERSLPTTASSLESTPVIFGIRLPNFTTYMKKCKNDEQSIFLRSRM